MLSAGALPRRRGWCCTHPGALPGGAVLSSLILYFCYGQAIHGTAVY